MGPPRKSATERAYPSPVPHDSPQKSCCQRHRRPVLSLLQAATTQLQAATTQPGVLRLRHCRLRMIAAIAHRSSPAPLHPDSRDHHLPLLAQAAAAAPARPPPASAPCRPGRTSPHVRRTASCPAPPRSPARRTHRCRRGWHPSRAPVGNRSSWPARRRAAADTATPGTPAIPNGTAARRSRPVPARSTRISRMTPPIRLVSPAISVGASERINGRAITDPSE